MKSELLKNTLIIGAGRVLAQFSSLLLIPIYTMFLSPDQLGVGDLIITYAALALPLVTLSLEQGAFRLLVDARKNEQQKTYIISFLAKVVLSLFASVTLVVAAAGIFLGIELVGLAIIYAAGSVGVGVCLWIARGLGDNKGYAKGSIIIGTSSLLLSLVAIVWLSMGLVGMLGALAGANIIGILYYTFRLQLPRYIRLKSHSKKISKELLSYSLPLVPNSISWWLVNAADRTMIAIFLGVAATGVFAVAVKFPAILIAVFSIFWISWHESASLHITSKGRDEFFSKVASTNILLFGSVGLLIISGLSVVFNYVVGPDFSEAYIYVPILMMSALLHTIATLYGSVYAAKMQTRKILNTTLLAAAISIGITILLINFIGLFAAAVASVVGYLVMTVYRHYDIQKFVKIRMDWVRIALFVLCTIVSVGLYYINIPILNIVNVLFVCIIAVIFNKGIIVSTKDVLWARLSRY